MKRAKLLAVSALSIMAFAWPVLAQTTGNNTTGGTTGNTTGSTTGSTTGTTGSVNGTTPGINSSGVNSGFTTGNNNIGINGNANGNNSNSNTNGIGSNGNNGGNNNDNNNNNVGNFTNSTTGTVTTINGNGTTNNRSITFDRRFLAQAAQGSLQEVSLGQLAQTNSTNPLVQQFGTLLVEDHTAAYTQAVALAQSLGFNIATNVTRAQLRNLQRLTNVSGTSFDNTFINLMVRDHIQDIQTYETAAQRASDATVRAYARAQLPVLMNHLVMALEIRETLGLTGLATATSR